MNRFLSFGTRHVQRLILAQALLLGLIGCAALGLPAANTFEQKALVAQATVTQVRASAAYLLNTRAISLNDAENALTVTDAATTGIAVARNLYSTACPPAAASAPPVACTSLAADQRLTVATAALTALSAYLTAQGAQP